MSHTIYTTDAIVLHRVSTAEADVTLWLLTRELGLVVARAQGARKGTAKMRGHLQLFSFLQVSLVRGKYIWRVTGVEAGKQGVLPTLQGEALSTFARIATFVRRMILTDTQSALELFEVVLSAREGITEQVVRKVELVCLVKVLIILGYIENDVLRKIDSDSITDDELMQVVNNAITESHL